MKTFPEIKRKAEKGDLTRCATIANVSLSLVKKVVAEERTDNNNIQRILSDIIEHRERLEQREANRRRRIAEREALRESKRLAA